MIPRYLRNFGRTMIHNDTTDQLPTTRLSTDGRFDEPAADALELAILAVDPRRTDGLGRYAIWRRLSELFTATIISGGSGAPTGSGTYAILVDRAIGADDPPLWTDIARVKLLLPAGGGLSVVSASIPVSVSGTNRTVNVRLVVDGTVIGPTAVTPASSSVAGNTNTVAFGPTTVLLTPGIPHVVSAQWSADSAAKTIYSTGSTITVTAAPAVLPHALDDAAIHTGTKVAALAGTSGTPSDANRFVTNSDSRNSDARTPTAHSHYAGVWSGATAYAIGAVVFYSGSSYTALAGDTGTTPGTNPAIWAVYAAQGPAGADGIIGSDGTGYLWQGTYSAGATYAPLDVVELSGTTYVCIATTTGNAPPNGAYWVVGSAIAGPAGADGTNGTNGAAGVGVPTGGTTGQALVKSSGTDYDTAWGTVAGGGTPHGTSFPGSPATGDRYRRDDIMGGTEYFYDGTRWLSTTVFEMVSPTAVGSYSSSSYAGYLPPPGTGDIWLVDMRWGYVVNTTHSATQYWTVGLIKRPSSGADTTVVTLTSNKSGTTWQSAAPTAIGALLGTDATILFLYATKAGSAGSLQLTTAVRYRLVGA